ncbi:MAG: SDR family oxidoreductase [Candidatus Eremiobacteraeota bacterium]|nr:SDR family oxidoreductase [Candidatus Eremiobacteraeota bacterium]
MSSLEKPAPPARKRSALITGAGAGLARGIALALARAGDDIAFTYRPGGTPPDQTLALLQSNGYSAQAFGVDFLAPEEIVETALAPLVARVLPDILVHAVGPMTVKRFERTTLADYHEMMDGNLRSAVQACSAVLPGMRERHFGRVIFFGLNGSQFTQPARGLTLHAAAKAGLVAFARALALEEGKHGITVNVVAPGDIREKYRSRDEARMSTAANPSGRPGSWEDVADAVLFLVRDDADFVNGAILNVAGGLADAYERNAQRP